MIKINSIQLDEENVKEALSDYIYKHFKIKNKVEDIVHCNNDSWDLEIYLKYSKEK